MSNRERMRVLRDTELFGRCSDDELRLLATFTDEVFLPAGTMLAEQGALCHEFVVVATGTLETCRSGRAGVLRPGETFGWEAMRSRGTNDASVRAGSPSRVLVMSHQQFRATAAIVRAA